MQENSYLFNFIVKMRVRFVIWRKMEKVSSVSLLPCHSLRRLAMLRESMR